MADRRRVTCINKTDRYNAHERISYIGSFGWKLTVQEAIFRIRGGDSFYVNKLAGTVDLIIARSSLGYEYLKTENDGEQPNNLLSLPECL